MSFQRLTSSVLFLACCFTPLAHAQDAYGPPPWGTQAGTVEFGLYGGAFFPSSKHELFDSKRTPATYQRLAHVAPEFGLRLGYFPLRVLGSDRDPALHVGIGAKAYLAYFFALRLDVRDTFTSGRGDGKITQHWEALLGLSFVLGRSAPPQPPPPPPLLPADSDGDGVIDTHDQCPQVAGVPPLGCPPDSDNDSILDPDDRCPHEAGVASTDPAKHGCPPPPPDVDQDGVSDASDACPTVAGDGPTGCPLDTDGDGIPNRDDRCPDQPETKNGLEDSDGCPDELSAAVKAFTGVIAGIAFDSGKATVSASSFATLDRAAKVLNDNPSLRVEISGHTDNTGSLGLNLTLSADRAAAVKAYLVGKGVAAERIETRGAGPNEPVADNATKSGRSKNRRIEFKLLQ